jgi:hypothetical protein
MVSRRIASEEHGHASAADMLPKTAPGLQSCGLARKEEESTEFAQFGVL